MPFGCQTLLRRAGAVRLLVFTKNLDTRTIQRTRWLTPVARRSATTCLIRGDEFWVVAAAPQSVPIVLDRL